MSSSEPGGRVPIETLLEHRDWVRALARHLVPDAHRADDVEQETWRMAIERPPRHTGSLRAWFGAVVRNAARKSRRGDAARERLTDAAPPPREVPPPEDVLAEAEVHAKVVRAVLDLEEPYASTVLYRYFHGLEPAAIAARLGVPAETVKTRLRRAIERLRTRMRREIGDERDAWCLIVLGTRFEGTPGAAAAPAAPVAAAGGILAMAGAGKAAVGVTVLALAALLWWKVPSEGEGPAGASAEADVAAAPAATGVPARSRTSPRNAAAAAGGAAERDSAVAAPDAAPRFRGVVVGPDEAPAAGVRIVLVPGGKGPLTTLDLAGPTTSSRRETRSGGDGRFTLDAPEGTRVASIVALAPDGATGAVESALCGEDVTIALEAPAVLAGTVTGPGAVPVPGTHVVVGCVIDAARLVFEARTGPDGSYRIPGVPAQTRRKLPQRIKAQVEFRAEGFAPFLFPMTVPETHFVSGEERRMDVRLLRGATLAGAVVDAETGQPLAGAAVELVSEAGMLGIQLARGRGVTNPFAPRTLGSARSAEDGTFRFEHVPPHSGRLTMGRLGIVRATLDGFATAEVEVPHAADGTTVELRVALRRAASIVGRVVDRDGAPLAGLRVFAQVGDVRNFAFAFTDAEGRYLLSPFPAPASAEATAVVRASRSHEQRDVFACQNSSAEVRVRAGEESVAPDLVWSLPDWPVVRIVVVDETGAPVLDAFVESIGDAITTLRCDDDGRAEEAIRPFPPDFPKPHPTRRRVVRAPGRAPALLETPPDPEDGREFRIVLGRGRRVKGRVLAADGKPSAGAIVRALDPGVPLDRIFEFDRRTSLDSLAHGWPNVPLLAAARTNSGGWFLLEDLPDGPFTVGAWSGKAGEWTSVGDVRGGGTDVLLRLPDPEAALATFGARVVLSVRDESGAPLSGCAALATGAGGAVWSRPGEPGTTVFAPLAAGTWRLTIERAGFVAWTKDGVVVERGRAVDPIEAVMRRGATVAGRVSLPDGATTGERVVLLVAESGEVTTTSLAPDGAFSTSGVAAGRFRLVVAPTTWFADPHPSFAADGTTVEVPAEQGEQGEHRADARFVAAGAVLVELTDQRLSVSGIPCDEAKWRFGAATTAEIRDARGAVVHSVRGVSRKYAFRHLVLPAGSYTVRVTFPEGAPAEANFDVGIGRTTTVKPVTP